MEQRLGQRCNLGLQPIYSHDKKLAMKRDMDLVRNLLLEIESHPELDRVAQWQFGPGEFGITENNFKTTCFHLDLLIEAGMVQGRSAMRMPIISGLTWEGCEFLDAIRDSKTWTKTKEGASAIGSWSVGVLVDLAKAYAKQEAKKRLGLDL